MARIFGRIFSKSGRAARLISARTAELRGDLAQAATFFAQAGRLDEAARVTILRGDAEIDAALRLRHYMQALAIAPVDSTIRTHACRKRWSMVVALAAAQPVTAALRLDLERAATELEAIGDHARAAEAFARAGDPEGQARALANAGDVGALDTLLSAELVRDRDANVRRGTRDEVALLVASGQRREAMAMAMAHAGADEELAQRGRAIERLRIAQSIVHAILRGKDMNIVLGNEVVIGRAIEEQGSTAHTGSIPVSADTISRRHLAVARRNGDVVVRDLGGRSATLLGGVALSGEKLVGSGIELRLGGEVPLSVRPTDELAGAVAIEVAGKRCVAPLGPALLGVGRWRLERGDDGWVELVTDDEPQAFARSLRLVSRVTLLAGDTIATERAGRAVLEVAEHGP